MIDSVNPILINGEPANDISVMDRGLAYGQGVFETIRIAAGIPLLWDAHLVRLQRGCDRLKIPLVNYMEALASDALRLAEGRDEAVLKVIVTAGVGGRGYRMSDIVAAKPDCRSIIQYRTYPAA